MVRHSLERHSMERHSMERQSMERHSLERHSMERHSLERHSVKRHSRAHKPSCSFAREQAANNVQSKCCCPPESRIENKSMFCRMLQGASHGWSHMRHNS
eukprot:TRINITY_DN13850_c0_g3_i1.p1 TRINITY_DN13850_c0_g3~~TRINITY_DN13850_c0_g3_i1.p1  ORF type:complete len:100 (+),score=1.18 TRINITY_DN13850_c0_g3_i1:156-455(+)